MTIEIDCITCFVKQAEKIIRKFIPDKKQQLDMMQKVLDYAKNFNAHFTPIELSPGIYHFLSEVLNIKDLYAEEKTHTNQKALLLEPFITKLLQDSTHKINAGVKLSIIGNILDYTVDGINELDLENFILQYFDKPLYYDHTASFYQEINQAKTLLYLTDNSGEIIFDRVFLRLIKTTYPDLHIIIAGKEQPILNDMTTSEIKELGFETLGTVLSTGSILPGNMEKYFTASFYKIFQHADVIIAKGQGNYEGLWECSRKIYFALMAKCHLIARNLNAPERSLIFQANH